MKAPSMHIYKSPIREKLKTVYPPQTKFAEESIGPWRHHLCIYKSLVRGNCLSSNSCHFVKNYFFQTKLLHAYVQYVYIVAAKYQIAPSKAVVGVDRPIKALSCIYKSHISEKLSKFSQLSFCQKIFILNQTPSCICSMCLYWIGKVSNRSIKSCGRSWSAHESTIYAYIQKPY